MSDSPNAQAQPKPTQQEQLTKVSCEPQMPNGPNTTVGELFTLTCKGDMSAQLKEPVHIVFPDPEHEKYRLKVSKVIKNDTGKSVGGELVLEVYSHVAGTMPDQKFTITDGTAKYDTQGVNWQIATVMKQGEKMYPPWGGMQIGYPMWLWFAILGFVLAVAGILAHFHRRARIRRQLILAVLGEGRDSVPFRELVKQQNAQAYSQFSRDLRGVQKKLSDGSTATKNDPKVIWSDLEKAFRYYLVRELLTPAFAWSRRQLLSDIKKHHRRVYDNSRRDLQQTLQELEKGLGLQNITLRDCEQLFQQARETAEKNLRVACQRIEAPGANVTFAAYWAFFFIIPIVAVAAYRWWAGRKKTPSVQFSSVRLVLKLPRSIRGMLSPVPLVLKCVALIFLVMALARPQEANTKIRRNVEGIDIMIVLDISDSMLIEDMQPNRLEAAKEIIVNFIKARTSDRIGFVVFAGEAYTRVPLTLDYPLLIQNVKDVKISRNIKMGTAIGVGMATGVARMDQSKAKSRVMIFLTDGENNSGTVDPETALQMAIDEKLRVYSIGVGRDGDAQLPVFIQDAFGNQIKQYRPIHSTVNEPLLRGFADRTGGRFWRANTGKELGNSFDTIDSLEKTKVDVDKFTRYTELFQKPLRTSLVFFILSLVLGRSVYGGTHERLSF